MSLTDETQSTQLTFSTRPIDWVFWVKMITIDFGA